MNDETKIANIILFTRGTMGDIYPFLRLGIGFKNRGCKVTLISNYCYENYAVKNDFKFIALDNKSTFDVLNSPNSHFNRESKLKLYKEHIISNIPREVRLIESQVLNIENSIIIANSNDILTPMTAAEKCLLPVYLCALAPSYIYGFYLCEAVTSSAKKELQNARAELGIKPIENWKNWIFSYEKCFAFWPEWFSNEASKLIANVEYAAFLSTDSVDEQILQREVKSFVADGFRVILLTHGTSRPFNDDYFRLGIEACSNLGCKVIVTTSYRELLPKNLPSNVMWVEYCPFKDLLAHIDLIVHHGGIGTVCESIANSVPQLIIGKGFDRQNNGKIVKNLNLGEWIASNALTLDSLKDKIKNLLENDKLRSICELYKPSLYSPVALDDFYRQVIQSCFTRNCLNGELKVKINSTNPYSDSGQTVSSLSMSDAKKNLLQQLLKEKTKKLHASKCSTNFELGEDV